MSRPTDTPHFTVESNPNGPIYKEEKGWIFNPDIDEHVLAKAYAIGTPPFLVTGVETAAHPTISYSYIRVDQEGRAYDMFGSRG